jgi:DNA-binding Lrp family transcriptional regulator
MLNLGSDEQGDFAIDANVVATGRTCVIGASGSGKSYAVGVICEELFKCGVPFAIIDTEGEHSGLKQKYDALWVGDEQGCDLKWSGVDLAQLGTQAPDLAPLILDLSEADQPKEKVASLLSSIYKEVERRRTPYLVVVEEADRFVPQNGERVAIFGEIARRGRKRGVGLMVCTQRPSLVDKNILSQCGNQLIGKLVIRNDLQAVSQFFQGHELPKQLTGLAAGRFYAMGGLTPVPRLVQIRSKETTYGGGTPKIGPRVVKTFVQTGMMPVQPVSGKNPLGPAGSADQTAVIGINPTFSEEDVPSLVRRDKSFVFFGREEAVSSANLFFRPMVELGVAVKTGLLRKRVQLRYLVLDGPTGRFVEFGDYPLMFDGFQRLIDLSEEQIEILREMGLGKDMGLLEIANKVGLSKEMLRKPLRTLEEKRLVRSFQAGRSKLLRRVYDFPMMRWHDSELVLEKMANGGRVEKSQLTEEKLREVVRGMIQHSEVHEYREFLYPFFRVELVMKRKKRIVWLDGRTGKEVRL